MLSSAQLKDIEIAFASAFSALFSRHLLLSACSMAFLFFSLFSETHKPTTVILYRFFLLYFIEAKIHSPKDALQAPVKFPNGSSLKYTTAE